MQDHSLKVARIQEELSYAAKKGFTVSFFRKSSNSTKVRSRAGTHQIDISDLDNILEVNTQHKYVETEPGVPMDALLDATLAEGLMPYVVPEFPGISVGGAIQGGALESSSFQHGQFNDSALMYEVLLSDGTALTVAPENEYSDLFWGLSTTYGSLALLTKIRLRLRPAQKFVNLTFQRCSGSRLCAEQVLRSTHTDHDFIEGLVFSEEHAVVALGTLSAIPEHNIRRFSRNIDPWYWRFVRDNTRSEDVVSFSVPVKDYLFRQDKGAFWMGEYAFPILRLPNNTMTRFLFVPFLRTRKLYDGLHALHIQQEFVIQDLYMDEKDIEKILAYNENKLKIYPLWMCPIKASNAPQKLSSHFRTHEQMLLNVGLYGKSDTKTPVAGTKELENIIQRTNDSRKMLYCETYYSPDELWRQYDIKFYKALREKYRAEHYRDWDEKVLSPRQRITSQKLKGVLNLLGQSLRGKNIVWW